jgi:hypothetical protein
MAELIPLNLETKSSELKLSAEADNLQHKFTGVIDRYGHASGSP